MPINPENTYILKGMKIRQYSLEKQSIPLSAALLSIYYVPEFPVRRSTLGEAMVRENKFGRVEFVADYYVDKLAIWETLPVRMDRLAIVLCGDAPAAKRNLQKLLKYVVKERKLEQRSIEFKFRNQQLEQELRDSIADVVEEPMSALELDAYEVVQETPIEVKAEFLQADWTTEPDINTPIRAIKITPSRGEVKYRVHSLRSNWSKWAGNGEQCGMGPIDGFQIQYSGEFDLVYCCHFSSCRATNWICNKLPQPYNIPITQIELELKLRE